MKSAAEWINSKTHLASKNVVTDRFEIADIRAIQTDARADLLAKIAAYEKLWTDMDFTICKLEQDLRKAKGEQ